MLQNIDAGTFAVERRRLNARRVPQWLRTHRTWLLVVALPTLLVAAYLYLIAANQYEAEAHFVVRSAEHQPTAPMGLGQALTMVGGASSDRDVMIVADYLTSHDAVAALQSRVGLISRFRRPEADIASRLWSADPTPEALLRYYNRKVNISINSDTGIATLRVRTFRPQDSLEIVRQLLVLSESRVNALNQRNYANSVVVAQRQVDEAERNVEQVQGNMTNFRQGDRDFNPQTTGSAQTQLVSRLQERLASARAQLAATSAVLAANSPQMVALRSRVEALTRQVASERATLSSGPGNVASGLGRYEGLTLRQELAGKQYEAAVASLQRSRDDANRQQLFLVPVVAPSLPVKSLYPESTKLVLTVFFALALAYGIGWLIAAGVREHAA